MKKNGWTYKKNQRSITAYLENAKALYVTDLQVRRSGRLSKPRIKKLLARSAQAFLTTVGDKLYISIENADGSIVTMGLAKTPGIDTSEL